MQRPNGQNQRLSSWAINYVLCELVSYTLSSSFGKLSCPQWIWAVGRGKLRVLRGGWCPHCLWISTCSVEANIWAAPPGSRPWYLGAPLLDIWAPSSWRAPLPLGNTLATLLFASSSYAILMFHSVFRAFDGLQWNWFDFGSILGRRLKVLLSILSQRGPLGRARCFRNPGIAKIDWTPFWQCQDSKSARSWIPSLKDQRRRLPLLQIFSPKIFRKGFRTNNCFLSK